ncbi:MAG TPA: hypothetical protein VFE15_06335 [Marmoricola sp.]|jgi:hypothetical protein|nr:hypothetical protein [Marmoricola sp.]
MRKRFVALAGCLVATFALVLVGVPGAQANTDDMVVSFSTPTGNLYAGTTGPFHVDFGSALAGDYRYSVTRGATTASAARTASYAGTGAISQLATSPLPAGTGYLFHIEDTATATHVADLSFNVLPGAAPTCSIVLPSQVRVTSPKTRIVARKGSGCTATHTTYAAWVVRHVTAGYANTYIFNGTSASTTSTWTRYDDEPTGTYQLVPQDALSTNNDVVPQNSPRIVVRFGSRLALTAHRSGKHVTLRTTLTRYVPSANRFKAWASRSVVLSYRTCTTCAWHRLRVRHGDAHGVASYSVTASAKRQYRAVVGATATIWGSTASVRR